jgi:hypothetical protein
MASSSAALWLLAFQERLGSPSGPVTQKALAAILGVGRPYASRQLKGFAARASSACVGRHRNRGSERGRALLM